MRRNLEIWTDECGQFVRFVLSAKVLYGHGHRVDLGYDEEDEENSLYDFDEELDTTHDIAEEYLLTDFQPN